MLCLSSHQLTYIDDRAAGTRCALFLLTPSAQMLGTAASTYVAHLAACIYLRAYTPTYTLVWVLSATGGGNNFYGDDVRRVLTVGSVVVVVSVIGFVSMRAYRCLVVRGFESVGTLTMKGFCAVCVCCLCPRNVGWCGVIAGHVG